MKLFGIVLWIRIFTFARENSKQYFTNDIVKSISFEEYLWIAFDIFIEFSPKCTFCSFYKFTWFIYLDLPPASARSPLHNLQLTLGIWIIFLKHFVIFLLSLSFDDIKAGHKIAKDISSPSVFFKQYIFKVGILNETFTFIHDEMVSYWHILHEYESSKFAYPYECKLA